MNKNIQNDLNTPKNYTGSTNSRQSLMLKMMTSYSIFLFIILALSVHLYSSYAQNARNQYQWQVNATLMSNVELFEKDLEIMNTYCRQLLQDNMVRNLARSPELTEELYSVGNTAATTMATDVYPEALLPMSEVFCYFPNFDFILGQGYFIDQYRYYNWIKKYSADAHEIFMEALTLPSNYYHFIPMNTIRPYSSTDYYMYIIDMNDLFYMDINAVVCFVLEGDKLSSLFECMNTDSPYQYLSVRTTPSDSILSIFTDESAYFDSLITDGLLDQMKDMLQSSMMDMDLYTSQDTGFTYYYSYPSYESTAKNAPPQILYAALFVAALAGGFILIFMLSARNIRPIIELDQQLQVTELEKSHLQEVMDSQRPIIFNSYVRQFLRGMIVSPEEASYAREFLGLEDENYTYNGLYVVAYNSANEYLSSSNEYITLEECNQIVLDTLKQYMGDPLYCFSPSDRVYALIVVGKPDDAKDLIIKTNEAIVKLHDHLLDTYGIWLFAGIGKNTDDILNVWESYQQAMEAVNYTSKNYIFFPYE
ncbi:MAG: hypothetical protein K2H91_07520, partial [Lachnospiraceae bacterium]|nr:hypothetical protein [Lachnospiraceae bacterium]